LPTITRGLTAVRPRPIQNVENNPMHSSRHQPDQWVTPFPNPSCSGR
jgi:hypothetical protein